MTDEQAKNGQDQSPEVKGELTKDALKAVSGGRDVTEQSVNN